PTITVITNHSLSDRLRFVGFALSEQSPCLAEHGTQHRRALAVAGGALEFRSGFGIATRLVAYLTKRISYRRIRRPRIQKLFGLAFSLRVIASLNQHVDQTALRLLIIGAFGEQRVEHGTGFFVTALLEQLFRALDRDLLRRARIERA